MISNLNNYVIFYTTAKTGNISRAANQLYISQPAISKAISKLEDELGAVLFSRSSRGVTLTDEGRLMYEYVERALENLSQGEDNVRQYGELGMGHIRIGVSTSLCKHILLGYMRDFIHDNPHVKLSIDCHSTLNTIKLLRNEVIDIGLICETDLPKGFEYRPVMDIHDVFIASTDYIENFNLREGRDSAEGQSLDVGNAILGNIGILMQGKSDVKKSHGAYASSILTPEETIRLLEKANLMVLEEGNVTRTHVDDYLRSHGIESSQLLEINSMDLLVDFARIGMGVSSVVREFAQEELSRGDVIELPLAEAIPARTVGFAYAGGQKMSETVKLFLEYH